jgi:hypothetical protein
MSENRVVIGLTEKVVVIGKNGRNRRVSARIDTGATKSSIDTELAAEMQLGPIVDYTLVKSASGSSQRPVLEAEIVMQGKKIRSKFTVAQREHMTYKVLIGQNILKRHKFLIDPTK